MMVSPRFSRFPQCFLLLAVLQQLLPAQTTVTLNASPNSSILGAPVVLTATVTPLNATGRVTFYDGVTLLGISPLAAGKASMLTGLLPSGTHRLKAYYGGDAANGAATSSVVTETVKAQPSSGSFAQAQGRSLNAYALVTADFNGDGKTDIALSVSDVGVLQVILGNGDGTFGGGRSDGYLLASPVAVGDFNGDGKTDLVVAGVFDGGMLSILLGNGDGSMQPPIKIGMSSFAVVVGDFNGDGKADLAVSGVNTGVTILLGKGDGTFQAGTTYPLGASALLVGDFNGDGKADLAVATATSASVSILPGNGDGTFQAPVITSVPALGSPMQSNGLVVGDFNQDGKPDLATVSQSSPLVSVLLGNGDGTFQRPVTYASLASPFSIVVGDFNGDGNPDLAAGNDSSIAILFGNGDGTFQAPAVSGATHAFNLYAGEFNGDGKTDLVTGGYVLLGTTAGLTVGGTPQSTTIGTPFPNPLEVTLRNNGNPVSGATVTFTAPATGPSATLSSGMALTDASGVSRVTATANLQPGSYTVTASAQGLSAPFTLSNTNGPPAILTVVSGTPQSAAPGAAFASALKVKLTDSAGNPASGVAVTVTAPASGASAVLSSGTAVIDAFGVASVTATAGSTVGSYAVTASFGALSVKFSLANLLVTTVTVAASPNPSVFGAPVVLKATVTPSIATGRVTFYDGVTILGSKPLSSGTASISTILLPAGNRRLTAYYSGDSTYLAASATVTQTVKTTAAVGFRGSLVSLGSVDPNGVAVGDFNGDGKPDLAVPGNPGNGTGSVLILLGNGDGTFQPPVNYPAPFNPETIAIGDFNGDGNADIIVTGSSTEGSIISMLPGNGDGTFGRAVNSVAGGPLGALMVADMNGDGKPDLVSLGGPALSVLLGNGDGTFGAPIAFTSAGFYSIGVLGDFNGDGKVDLATVAVSGNTGIVVVVYGNGDGTFQAPVRLNALPITGFPSLAAADFNGDGKTDLVIGDETTVAVLLGNGDGTFRAPVSYPVAGAVTTGDFNGDGIIDIAAVAGLINGSFVTNVNILQGNGDGTFHQALSYTTSAAPFTALVADFNGDGRADIVTANNDNGLGISGGSLNILLGVTAGVSLTATRGVTQSAFTQSQFAVPLQVTVVQDGKPVPGASVTFTAPSSGASAVLSSATAVTNSAGVASITATANGVAGSYAVTASYQGLTATFSLTNATIGSITASGGTPQITPVGFLFQPLQVTVRDSAGNLTSGAVVTFTAPGSGASAALSPSTAVTNAFGQASVSATANNIAGSYFVTASVGGLTASFSLTNQQVASITASGGTPQSAAVGTTFAVPLEVTVRDTAGRPVNAFVRFTAPSTGASAVLPRSPVGTNAAGVVGVMAVANNTVGSYTVTATVTSPRTTSPLTASFSLTNLPAGSTGATNVALGKNATQSSTFPGSPTAAAAVDGNTDGNFADGSVTATNADPNAWWQVDLGASASVSSVEIWNRTDCCGSRLSDFWVFTSDTPFLPTDTPDTLQNRAGTFSSRQTAAPDPSTTITGIAQGRYVRVQLTGTDYLSLAEVQVMGTGGAPTPADLALGRLATQSSTYPGYLTDGAQSAVDGGTDGNFLDGSVTATNADPNAWWQVDLGGSVNVSSVEIWNRTDCCGTRLGDYWVFVSDTPFLPSDTPATLQNRAGTFASHQTAAPDPSAVIAAGARGRYVRVQLTGTDYLSLAEVQVFGVPVPPVNLALGKNASQSSTLPGYPTAVAASAVDGNTDGNFFDGSVTVTNLDVNPWWQVDLGASSTVNSIVIWNRTDCCAARLNSYWILVSDTPFGPNDTPTTLSGRPGTFVTHQFFGSNPSNSTAIGAQGRYVRVQLAGTDYLSLAEVQVFGQ
jgi:hypothetical protein